MYDTSTFGHPSVVLTELTIAAGLLALAIGATGGTVSGLLGVGGAAVLSPLFQLAFGWGQRAAQGVSLAVILPPVGIPALLAYRARGIRPSLRTVAALVGTFALCSYCGGQVAQAVPERALTAIFLLFLLVSAYRVVRAAQLQEQVAPAAVQQVASPVAASLAVLVAIGGCAGFCAGLMGIGGGIIVVPALQRFARLSRLDAQATSLAMMLPPIGLPAVYVYAARSEFPLGCTLVACAGFAVGAYFGGRASTSMKPKAASYAFAGLLLTLGGVLAVRAALGWATSR
jgi:uncharacterized protein